MESWKTGPDFARPPRLHFPDHDRVLHSTSVPGGRLLQWRRRRRDRLFRSFEFPDSFPIPCSPASHEIQSYDSEREREIPTLLPPSPFLSFYLYASALQGAVAYLARSLVSSLPPATPPPLVVLARTKKFAIVLMSILARDPACLCLSPLELFSQFSYALCRDLR